ncbi:DMT family transporter [Pandoraea cepalis]|uniref:Membrane protein n=1 Tax=Pandoraea cepalis TaxID=2508294 RepID=A0A5E4Y5P2_9BURK|nr:DMT family transporter [Pandoraea cepalis]VVE43642.1 membrane protein [Pandoraea cepalis]
MQSLWMLVSAFMFTLMGLFIKLAANEYNTGEIILYRSLIGVVVLLVLARARGHSIRTRHLGAHVKRSTAGVISLGLWFYSLTQLPLSTAMTLNYMSPIWISLIVMATAAMRGSLRADFRLVAAIFAGFVGVALLLQPTIDSQAWTAGVAGVVSGVFSAIAYMQVKDLGTAGEPDWRIVFYFSLGGVLLGLGWVAIDGMHALTWRSAGLMLGVGIAALVAQTALTRAFSLGNTLVTANLQYSGVIFATLVSMLVWDDWPALAGWIGMLLIVASGMTALRRPSATA